MRMYLLSIAPVVSEASDRMESPDDWGLSDLELCMGI